MANPGIYYKLSGRFSLSALLTTCLVAGVEGLTIGAIYGIADHFCTFLYGKPILILAAGLAMGLACRRMLVKMHVRSLTVSLLVCILAGVLAEYAAFVTWVWAALHYNHLLLIARPDLLLGVLQRIVEVGAWTVQNHGTVETARGAYLQTIWTIETAILIGMPIWIAFRHLRRRVYCENCRQWITKKTSVLPFVLIANAAGFRAKLEAGKIGIIADLSPVGMEVASYSYLEVRTCPTCRGIHLLSVWNYLTYRDSRGRRHTSDTPIVHNLLIDAPMYDAILALRPDQVSEPEPESALESAATETAPPATGQA